MRKGVQCIGLYTNVDALVDLGSLLDVCVHWFNLLGYPPDLIGLKAPGFTGKAIQYQRALKRLTPGLLAQAKDFDLMKLPAGSIALAQATIEAIADKESGRAIIGIYPSVHAMDNAQWIALANQLYDALPFTYGYAYERPPELGHLFYAVGIIQGLEYSPTERYEAAKISRWGTKLMYDDSRCTLIRQVYRFQFLSDAHLARKVDRASLADWIYADPHRGHLAAFRPSMWTWTLDSDEDVEKANHALYEANILCAWWPQDAPEPPLSMGIDS